tara:strand:- start:362 stop:877 length:516 start_codon:yes stop_codon:yes gene_type:complete
MQQNDILMKKWCFGIGRVRKTVETNSDGEAEIVRSFPRYRTIVMKVASAKRLPDNKWEVEADKYTSLTKPPKRVKVVLDQKQHMQAGKIFSSYEVAGEKKPFYHVQASQVAGEGMPPVGSLVTLNKRHAIVTETGQNCLTVWMDNKFHEVVVKPGSVRWHSDKILANAVKS